MDRAGKNVALLSACQGLLLTNNSILIATNGLAGYALAADKALATLPVDVLLATAGRDRRMALPANVQAMAFVDGHAACLGGGAVLDATRSYGGA